MTGSERDIDIQAALRSQIGPWSEVKLEIIREYAEAFSVIFNAPRQRGLQHIYVDAFAGAGYHLSRASGAIVPGSPTIALGTAPPFREYHFIDIQELRVQSLERIAARRTDVFVHHGDANLILSEHILPRVRYEDYRRGLFLLDPYGMHYEWSVVEAIGKMRTIDLFLNFPIMDINMNALHRVSGHASQLHVERMNRFWGDESWSEDFYSSDVQLGLFGDERSPKESGNEDVVGAYVKRLQDIAEFSFTPKPMAMRNSTGATVYYLVFASHNRHAGRIAEQIFEKYRKLER